MQNNQILQVNTHYQFPAHYEILGVGREANDNEINNAFKHRSLQFHPDKVGGNTQMM